jgi:transposase-like protein
VKGTEEMVKHLVKLDILRWHFNEGKPIKEIARELKISKNTVKKYIREFENQKEELKDTNTADSEIVELMLEKPKYDATNRKRRVLTDEIIEKINEYLEENEFKKQNR